MSLAYAGALALSILGMVILDHRHRLFFFADARRAAVVLLAGVAFFVAWDLAGVGLGIFARGQTPYMTGILLAPHLPIEEIGFLVLLSYLTMNLYAAFARWSPRGRRSTTGAPAAVSGEGRPGGAR
ncbi:lycopene cyclase domain-containing protein [Actinotalea subterranea]|uniref:lycopene cyclase domain-containing protein n=1 Tax=Actinotalea subterranea TaxID=2607497 RepID=UPI0011ED136D|nr:lycopene cyclase domain-containing protein [Actinotalea subterranea]